MPDIKKAVTRGSFGVAVTAAVAFATHAGALPGAGMGLSGTILEIATWISLYIASGMAYGRICGNGNESSVTPLQNIGICLLLTIGSLYVTMDFIAPNAWENTFYLRYLSPLIYLCIWFLVLFRGDTIYLYRVITKNKAIQVIISLMTMLMISALLVSWSDYTINNYEISIGTRNYGIIRMDAWVTNTLILFGAYALVFAVTSKVSTSLLFVSPFYVVLNLATIAKMKYMHATVSPLDLMNVPEFLPLFRDFFGTGVFLASILAIIAWIAGLVVLRRTAHVEMSIAYRGVIGGISLILVLTVPFLYSWPDYNMEDYYDRIGGPMFHITKEYTRESGILLTFLAEVPQSFLRTPTEYSKDTVVKTSLHFSKAYHVSVKGRVGKKINLIVIMVESFMDPKDLGYRYTYDPIPNFHAMQKKHTAGSIVVPGPFGGSINSEFEMLTGMSTSFLPDRSVPYRQFVKQPLPSLPWALKKAGYRTISVQADPMNWFNREKVYDLLGFDEKNWLHDEPGVERSRKGWWPSDREVARRIIRASQGGKPFFVFSFPSESHAPYNTGIYKDSDLKVVDSIPGDVADEVNEYINSLKVTDREIGKIIGHFDRHPDPTILIVLGDHLPPLSRGALRPFYARLSGLRKSEQEWMIRRVPLLVWANFRFPKEKVDLSLNALPSYLLERMRIPSSGFIAVSSGFRRRIPILSKHIQGSCGSVWDFKSLPVEEKSLIDNCFLLQYDTLVGKRYSMEPISR